MNLRLAATGLLALVLLAGCIRSNDSAPAASDPQAANDPDATPTATPGSGKDDPAAPLGSASPEVHNGRLESGDATLRTGEYVDEYKVSVQAGQWIDARMTSSDFDPYLIVVAPSGEQEDNDDEDRAQGTAARIRMQATESGLYAVRPTSYQSGDTGAYTVTVAVSNDGGGGGVAAAPKPDRTAAPLNTPLPTPTAAGARVERGTLAAGDATLRSGEYYDTYTFQGQAGEQVVVDMTSSAFDPYLILWKPDGSQEDNDDYNGSTSHAQIAMTLPAAGTYRVGATSYAAGATGPYEVTIQQSGGGGQGGTPPFPKGK